MTNYNGFIKKIDRRKPRVKALFVFSRAKHYIGLSVNFIEKFDNNILGKEIPFFYLLFLKDTQKVMKLYLNLGKDLYFKHNFLKHSGLRVSLTRYLATVGVQIHCSLSLHGRGSFTVLRLWEYKWSAR